MAPTPADLRSSALAYAAALEAEAMSGQVAAKAVQDLSVAEKAVATARMFLALRVAQTDAWRGQGHASAADWLAAQVGITVSAAHTQLGTAKKAKKRAKTKKAMDEGKLSPTQADAVTDGASADPDAEEDLLSSAANDTTKNLKEKAAKARAAATDSKERERRIRRERTLRMRTDADGAFSLYLRGPAVDGARLQAMLKPFQEEAFRAARSRGSVDGVKDTFDNREYDAFWNLVDHLNSLAGVATHLAGLLTSDPSSAPGAASDAAPDGGPATGSGTGEPPEPACDADAGSAAAVGQPAHESSDGGPPASARRQTPDPKGRGAPPPSPQVAGSVAEGVLGQLSLAQRRSLARKLPGGSNTKVIINIDLAALRRGHTESGERCEISGLGPISVEVAEQLMNDAFIASVIRDGTHVHTVVHHGRGLNAHQRTAIEATGIRCSNIACNHTVAIQVDHRTPWADDPVTHLANQDPLCPNCHRQKTHHGHRLESGSGPRRLLSPEDQVEATRRNAEPATC